MSRDAVAQRLILLHHEGWSIRALCRHFGTSRNAVRRILRAHAHAREQGHEILPKRLPRGSKLEAFAPEIRTILARYPRITAVRLREKLLESGYAGGITILRERLAAMRPRNDPVLRFETPPGLQGQQDWSPYTLSFTRTGKATVQCFSYILGFSRRQVPRLHDPAGLLHPHPPAPGRLRVLRGRAAGMPLRLREDGGAPMGGREACLQSGLHGVPAPLPLQAHCVSAGPARNEGEGFILRSFGRCEGGWLSPSDTAASF